MNFSAYIVFPIISAGGGMEKHGINVFGKTAAELIKQYTAEVDSSLRIQRNDIEQDKKNLAFMESLLK
jgi:hypothetical protein